MKASTRLRIALGSTFALLALQCGDKGGAAAATDSGTGGGTATDTDVEPCGDGFYDPQSEGCDDGNLINGDDCNADCQPSQTELWNQEFDHEGARDCALSVAVDGMGNTVAVGYVTQPNGTEDIWLRKYAPDGSEVWTRTTNGPSTDQDRANSVIIDGEDNIVATGFVTGTLMQGKNLWTRQYSPEGESQWTKVYVSDIEGDDLGTAIAWVGDGFVVAGSTEVGPGDTDVILLKYDKFGRDIWDTTAAGVTVGIDRIQAMAPDSDGFVVAGYYQDLLNDERVQQAWVRKYTAAGVEVWNAVYNEGSPEGNQATSVVVASDGTIVVAGAGQTGSMPSVGWVRFLARDGTEQSMSMFSTGDGEPDVTTGLAISSDGQVTSIGTNRVVGVPGILVKRYDSTGSELWSKVMQSGTGGPAQGFGVVADPDDKLILVGCSGLEDESNILVKKFTP